MADDNHPLDTPAAGRDMPADPQRRLAMADAARTLARPDAAARVADAVLAAAQGGTVHNKEAA